MTNPLQTEKSLTVLYILKPVLYHFFKGVIKRSDMLPPAACLQFTDGYWFNLFAHILEHIGLIDTDDVDNVVEVIEAEDMDNLKPGDRFLLDVLKICPRLRSLDLKLGVITDRACKSMVLCNRI